MTATATRRSLGEELDACIAHATFESPKASESMYYVELKKWLADCDPHVGQQLERYLAVYLQGDSVQIRTPLSAVSNAKSEQLSGPFSAGDLTWFLSAALVWLAGTVFLLLGMPFSVLLVATFIAASFLFKATYGVNKLHHSRHGDYLISPHYLVGGFAVSILLTVEALLVLIRTFSG